LKEDPKFGTDGVRGLANADLSAYFAFRLGRTAGALLPGTGRKTVVVGRDTRISGDMLEAALVSGFLSVGVDVVRLGILPTAGVAYVTCQMGAAAGAVISASHNPMPDNGIKFFGADGRKLADEIETAIEEQIDDFEQFASPTGAEIGRLLPGEHWVEEYVGHLRATSSARLDGMRIVMDCAHGAAYLLGPRVARQLGAEVIALNDAPDGTNINAGVGATHPEVILSATTEHRADLGVCFDGDADRAIFADERGRLVDGDRVMGICALAWKGTDRLPGDLVVGTVMSNMGLELGLAARDIRLQRAPVGDRHVADQMQSTGAGLGGEKSGHILFARHSTTGDGIITLLQVAGLMREADRPLSQLADQFEELPQRLVNVPVYRRRGWRTNEALQSAIRRAEARLEGHGRVLVRASGTERIIRVMAEGKDLHELDEVVADIAGIIRETMGQATAGVSLTSPPAPPRSGEGSWNG
jgi:phosphoglucosamine mutase